ncbi:MAG: phosphatase PAP2 family protein [Muribaculaceae bacterium]|nr:phosphatase PAP2 family protein [Muribaculaceae bacterium]
MKIDKSDYYPYTPGSGCDPDEELPHEKMEESGIKDEIAEAPVKEETESRVEEHGKGKKPKPTFLDLACNALSWILVPMLVSVWGTIMIFNLSTLCNVPYSTKLIFTLIVLAFNAAIPLVLVAILKIMGLVQDIGLNGRKERYIPYIIMIASYVGTALFFHAKHAPEWTCLFFYGAAVAAAVNMIVNFRWKISAHAASMAGLVAMLLIINRVDIPSVRLDWWIAATILLSGMLGSARIWLGRHTLGQVLAGYASGFLSVYLISFLYPSIV